MGDAGATGGSGPAKYVTLEQRPPGLGDGGGHARCRRTEESRRLHAPHGWGQVCKGGQGLSGHRHGTLHSGPRWGVGADLGLTWEMPRKQHCWTADHAAAALREHDVPTGLRVQTCRRTRARAASSGFTFGRPRDGATGSRLGGGIFQGNKRGRENDLQASDSFWAEDQVRKHWPLAQSTPALCSARVRKGQRAHTRAYACTHTHPPTGTGAIVTVAQS